MKLYEFYSLSCSVALYHLRCFVQKENKFWDLESNRLLILEQQHVIIMKTLVYFFLQIFFAIIPPVHFCGGWLTFFVALIFMIIMTVIVGDLASIFGCLCGLEKPITAITIVALGKENQTSDNLVDVMMGC